MKDWHYVDWLAIKRQRESMKRLEWTMDYAHRIYEAALRKRPDANRNDLRKWAFEEAYKRWKELNERE